MKNYIAATITAILALLTTTAPSYSATQWMTDRPGELIKLAEQLANKIQAAETTRDQITKNIQQRSQALKEINDQIMEPGQTRAQKLELMAKRNQLEREENRYRKEVLIVVKKQMSNIFSSLTQMRNKLQDMQGQETTVDREAVQKFNRYFAVSAQLIRGAGIRGRGADPKTMSMLETLEKNLIVTRKSTDFVEKAIKKLVEYQKIVALYNARLSYLETGLSKHRDTLGHQRDGITVSVSLGAAERFMDGLDTQTIEDTFMNSLSTDPSDFYMGTDQAGNEVRMKGARVKRLLERYSQGKALE